MDTWQEERCVMGFEPARSDTKCNRTTPFINWGNKHAHPKVGRNVIEGLFRASSHRPRCHPYSAVPPVTSLPTWSDPVLGVQRVFSLLVNPRGAAGLPARWRGQDPATWAAGCRPVARTVPVGPTGKSGLIARKYPVVPPTRWQIRRVAGNIQGCHKPEGEMAMDGRDHGIPERG